MAVVLVCASHLPASVKSWDDFDSAASGYYDSPDHWGDSFTAIMLDLDEFNIDKILWRTDSVQLFGNPDKIYGQDLFHYMSINEISYAMPDELLTLQLNSQPSIPDQPLKKENDVQLASEPADDFVLKNDADNIESLRTPAPSSLLLVVIGLISLRYSRLLRL
jgi:hypothetical protein